MQRIDSSQPRHRRQLAVSGALGSALLHALLFTPVLLGFSQRHSHPQPPISSSEGAQEEAMILTLLEDESVSPPLDRSLDEPNLRSPSLTQVLAPIALSDISLPDIEDDDQANEARASQSAAGDPGQAQMFGRYIGQIDARVQRAWIRPRTSIATGLFACRARITQDHNGQVQEIELVRCNGDIAWQMSLVHAIQSASPLPAPPDPKVFSPKLTLDFHSQPFSTGMEAEGFERVGR